MVSLAILNSETIFGFLIRMETDQYVVSANRNSESTRRVMSLVGTLSELSRRRIAQECRVSSVRSTSRSLAVHDFCLRGDQHILVNRRIALSSKSQRCHPMFENSLTNETALEKFQGALDRRASNINDGDTL